MEKCWICSRVSYFTVCRNLNRICILMLCENCIKLNYVKLVWFTLLFRSTISFYFSVYYTSFWDLDIETSTKILICLILSLSHVQLFVTSWTASCQASLSFTISWSLLKLISIKSALHLILCCPLLLLPSIFPSIRVFSSESALFIRSPKYWSFSLSISPSKEYSGLISF